MFLSKFQKICISFCLVIFCLGLHYQYTHNRAYLDVVFFDVGQGDATLIVTPHHRSIIIDGGPDNRFVQRVGQKLSIYDRTIDWLILTHPHADHYTGLIDILNRYEIKNILINPHTKVSRGYDDFLDAVVQEHARVVYPRAMNITIDGLILSVLYPFGSIETPDDWNEVSIALRMEYGTQKIMFTGDLPTKQESLIIKKYSDLDVDILKVGHHGSSTSTSDEWLRRTSPQFAIIMCGVGNMYGHPHPSTLRRLKKYGIKVLRTDLRGDIIFHIYPDHTELVEN